MKGYLMHTLPVSVHEQIWGKLIVATVWIAIDTVLSPSSILVMFLKQGSDFCGLLMKYLLCLSVFRNNFGVSPVAAGLVWIPLFILSKMAGNPGLLYVLPLDT